MSGYGIFVYGSSAFILPVKRDAPSIAVSTVPWAFALRSMCFAASNLALGPLTLRGPTHYWVAGAVVLMCLACAGAAASVAASSAAALCVALPILGGAACTAFYVPVYHPILSWFPDRRGFIAGMMGKARYMLAEYFCQLDSTIHPVPTLRGGMQNLLAMMRISAASRSLSM